MERGEEVNAEVVATRHLATGPGARLSDKGGGQGRSAAGGRDGRSARRAGRAACYGRRPGASTLADVGAARRQFAVGPQGGAAHLLTQFLALFGGQAAIGLRRAGLLADALAAGAGLVMVALAHPKPSVGVDVR